MEENMTTDLSEEIELTTGSVSEEEDIGKINIAPEVVSTIAGIATNEIEGVAGMRTSFASGITEFLTKKNTNKGVKVDIQENNVIIDLSIVVDYGVRIPELAWEIQENVKNSVETMTGLVVEKVNIHIDGVSFEKVKKQQNETEKLDIPEVIVEETTIDEIKSDEDNDIQ